MVSGFFPCHSWDTHCCCVTTLRSVRWEVTHSRTILVCQAQWNPVSRGKKVALLSASSCLSLPVVKPSAEGASIDFNTHPEWHLINRNKKIQTLSLLQPITSLSRTNYANCLCYHASLEGRSFIPFFYSYLPPGLLLLCGTAHVSALPFHLLRFHLWLRVWLRGHERDGKQKCAEKPPRMPVAHRDLCTSGRAQAGYRRMCCFPSVCASSYITQHAFFVQRY